MIKFSILSGVIVAIFLTGCAQLERSDSPKKLENIDSVEKIYTQSGQRCDLAWYEKVDQQVITGDGQGHGPDLGSLEWRSVVEFKLGIRGNESNPELGSDLWCDYIDKQYMNQP